MNRSLWVSLAMLSALLLTAAACTEKVETKTVTRIVLPAPDGAFPGTQPAQHLTALDGAAFSPPGENASLAASDMRYYPSGTGKGILLFQTTDAAGSYHVYASHFDGISDLTPAVELVCSNQDTALQADLNRASVLFFHYVSNRDGDALVFLPRTDIDIPGNPAANANTRLYFAYFDASLRGEAFHSADPAFRWGFDTQPDPVDGSDTEDVHLTALLSNGLIGAGRFPAGAPSDFRQGNVVNYAAVLYSQAASPSSPERLCHRLFDFDSGTLAAAAEVPLDTGASATDNILHSAGAGELNTYNNMVFFLRDNTATSDEFLLASVLDPENKIFLAQAHLLSPAAAATVTAEPPSGSGRGSIWGPDEGLAAVTGIFPVTGYNQAGEQSLMAFQINPSDYTPTGFDATLGIDLLEVDGGQGAASAYSADLATAVWTINRPGTVLYLFFLQDRSETTAIAGLWGNAIRLARGGDTRLPLSDQVSGAVRLDTNVPADPVEDFQIPQDLDYLGFQDDPLSCTIAWEQEAGAGSDTLRHNRLALDTSVTPPVISVGTEGTVAFPDTDLDMANIVVTDGGGSGGAPGAAYLYFIRNAQTGSYGSYRAVQISTATGVETVVGSLVGDPTATYQPREALSIRVMTTPLSTDLESYPGWSGTYQHLFITEYRYYDSVGTHALRHRLFLKQSTAALPGDRFNPPADGSTSFKAPVTLDACCDADAAVLETAASGDEACVFILQGLNLFYNQYDPSSRTWYPAATLVDNDGTAEGLVSTPRILFQRVAANSPSFYRTLVLWDRTDDAGVDRLFARIRD